MTAQSLIISTLIGTIYLIVCYVFNIWKTYYWLGLVGAFAVGFFMIYFIADLTRFTWVERIGFSTICGMLEAQVYHVMVTHVFNK